MKSKNYFPSKVSLLFKLIIIIDIDNILDNNAENMFFKNVSTSKKSQDSSKSNKSKKIKKKNKFSEYLKNGFLDYSFDSNSSKSKKDENENKETKKNNKHKKKNFILKSELFSSPDNEPRIKSEKVSPRSSILK